MTTTFEEEGTSPTWNRKEIQSKWLKASCLGRQSHGTLVHILS